MRAADLLLVTRAARFAARSHVDQHRKGVAKEPYINHLAEVALLLAEATEGKDPILIAAGWLHDTVEDTPASREDIAEAFGEEVAAVVAEVTDDKSLEKGVRKKLQIEQMAKKSERAQLLKLADKTSNIRGVATSPPAGWSKQQMSDYVDWGEAVIAERTVANAYLEEAFERAVRHARDTIERMEG